MSTPVRPRAVLTLVGAAACWGIGTVISKHALGTVEPFYLLAAQLTASTVFLFAVLGIQRQRIVWTPALRRLAALGTLNPGLAYALGLLGLKSISASMSVLIWAVEPVLILLLAWIVLRERVSVGLRLAFMTALAGVLLVVYQPGAAGTLVGVLLTFAAVGACATYTVATRSLLVDDASLPVAAVQQATAMCFALVLLAVSEMISPSGSAVTAVPATTWMWAIASGLIYYGVAFWLYVTGLTQVSASIAGMFLPLVPVFGVAGALLIGEQLSGRQWIGAAIVVGAVAAIAAIAAIARMQMEHRSAPTSSTAPD